jgi:hypothetical protein
MTELTQAADTAAMRAEADQLNASVREDNRSLYERQRRAAQLAYEADLLDDAVLSHAAWQGASSRLPMLDAAVQEAIGAERAAEDRLRAEDRQLSRVKSELAKADPADGDAQERLALRVHARQGAVDACSGIVRTARDGRLEAQQALSRWQAYVDELEADRDQARAKAENPGTAPNMPALSPGVAKVSDLDEETKQYLGLVAILTSQLGSIREAQQLPNTDPRQSFSQQDPSQMRFMRTADGRTLAIPPAQGR